MQITPPPLPNVNIQIASEQIEAIRKLAKQREVEIDIVTLPAPVPDDDGRPFLPNLLMVVDSKSGMVLASEMLPRADTPLHTAVSAVNTLLAIFIRLKWAPKTIFMRHNPAEQVFRPLMKMIDVKLKLKNRLTLLDQALESLFHSPGDEWISTPDLDDTRLSVRHRDRR